MRVEDEPAYVLEARPYRETSLLLDVFSRDHGRLALVARGVRAAGARADLRRAALVAWQPLRIGWRGRGEVMSLAAAEPEGPGLRPQAAPLFAALYVNELLLRLTARGDPQPDLFARYRHWLSELARLAAPVAGVREVAAADGDADAALAWSLRRFERDLLAVLGYALALDFEGDSGEPLDPDGDYALDPEHGARRWCEGSVWPRVRGATLLAWSGEALPDPAQGQALKRLARTVLRHHLGGGELRAWSLAAKWRPAGSASD